METCEGTIGLATGDPGPGNGEVKDGTTPGTALGTAYGTIEKVTVKLTESLVT